MKKYEILKEDSIKVGNHTLYRIKALREFGDVAAGELGGYIESEKNLSHRGSCWIYNDSKVYEDAEISDHADVLSGTVYGNVKISGCAEVSCSTVYGNAEISDDAMLSCSTVYGNAKISDDAKVSYSTVYGNAKIRYYAMLSYSTVYDNAEISAKVRNSTVYGNVEISGVVFQEEYGLDGLREAKGGAKQ